MKYVIVLCVFVCALFIGCDNGKSNDKNLDASKTGNQTPKNIPIPETVTIGSQVWMGKNLDVDHYRNGNPVPEVKDKNKWTKLKTGAWCYFNNDPENGKKFGKLYNWYAVNDPRGLAPNGWHIPTKSEFQTLCAAVGGDGNALKAVGQGTGASAGTNTSGFSALLSGIRGFDGVFYFLGDYTNFRSSSEYDATNACGMGLGGLGSAGSGVDQGNDHKALGYSVRCVKD